MPKKNSNIWFKIQQFFILKIKIVLQFSIINICELIITDF